MKKSKNPVKPKCRRRDTRDDQYAAVARLAVKNCETDKLVRHLMAAGLAQGDGVGATLAQDLTLLRWCLKKMEQNRREAEFQLMQEENVGG